MLVAALWHCMWRRGLRGSNSACSTLYQMSVTSPTTHMQIGPLWCWFLRGWTCAHSRPLWVSPRNSPVRLGVSPAAASTPIGVFNQRFEALFPWAGLCDLLCFPTVPPGLSMRECGTAGSTSHYLVGPQGPASASCSLACPVPQLPPHWVHQPPPCPSPLRPAACFHPSYWSGWVFLLYLLGCQTSIHWIFCQFWLFFVFKLLLSFFCLCKEAQCVYLCLHLDQKPRVWII